MFLLYQSNQECYDPSDIKDTLEDIQRVAKTYTNDAVNRFNQEMSRVNRQPKSVKQMCMFK